MRLYIRLANAWPTILASGLALGALALLWRVRDTPLEFGALGRVDALSAFFTFALFAGAALVLRPADLSVRWWRPIATMAVLALAFNTTLIFAIAGAYLISALLTLGRLDTLAPRHGDGRVPARQFATGVLRQAALVGPGLLASSCLLVGYGALALRGIAHYDDRTAGAVMDSFVFWFVLLAAIITCAPLGTRPTNDQRPTTNSQKQRAGDSPSPPHSFVARRWSLVESGLFRFAWLYPLARLYSIGPWNTGWSFAALLLGGTIALWCACSALAQPVYALRSLRIRTTYLALALAGIGLSTSAGIAAGCYGILTHLVLLIPTPERREVLDHTANVSPRQRVILSLAPWLLSSAVPCSAPFVAAWMLMGAGVGGGVALLAGAAWLAALLHGLTTALWSEPGREPPLVAAAVSILIGIGAPLVVRQLIQPVVAQLQGGLTPYGEVNIWPWVGLATSNSAHTQVTTLPSIAIAALMLVLSALVYVVERLRSIRGDAGQPTGPVGEESPDADDTTAPLGLSTLLHGLRDEVPWLGGLLGPDPRGQGQRRDIE